MHTCVICTSHPVYTIPHNNIIQYSLCIHSLSLSIHVYICIYIYTHNNNVSSNNI